jgi:hypothetical protein
MTQTEYETRELDFRSGNGIEVRLLWEPHTDNLWVTVVDERTDDRFQITVDPDSALDAFRHPYAYGAGRESADRTDTHRIATERSRPSGETI